jgi:hypothetical protein
VDPLQREDDEGEFEEFSLGQTPAETNGPGRIRQPQQEIPCPSCGSANPASNRHCEECGARLSQGSLPVAPRPGVQTTAGVRAAVGISGVLVVVVLAVILVSVFGGGEDGTGDTVASDTTSTTVRREPVALEPLSVRCSVAGISGLDCDNLWDGDPTSEYQFNWVDFTAESVDNPTITITFPERVIARSVVWHNITDATRFQQNYRVARLSISDQSDISAQAEVTNQAGQQVITYVSFATFDITIEITQVHDAQQAAENIFEELAIAEIEVWGYPADEAPTTGSPTETTGETTTETTGDTTTETTG